MGYRSDVRIITSKKGFNKLKDYVNDEMRKLPNGTMIYNLLENLDLEYENDNSKYFGWNNVKWYYEDVDMVMTGLKYLEKNDYSYRYARIGEGIDDCEEDYFESLYNKDEQDLEYPSIARYFEDDYIIDNMKFLEQKDDKEI